jgi:hypothetical protein
MASRSSIASRHERSFEITLRDLANLLNIQVPIVLRLETFQQSVYQFDHQQHNPIARIPVTTVLLLCLPHTVSDVTNGFNCNLYGTGFADAALEQVNEAQKVIMIKFCFGVVASAEAITGVNLVWPRGSRGDIR